MNRSNRRLFTILLSLVLSITLLASSTYAWFSSNREVMVNDLSVRISALNKLEVSADAREFGASVTLADIMSADYVEGVERLNSTPTAFEPVSTVGNLVNGKLDMYHGIAQMDIDQLSVNYGKTTLVANSVSDVDGLKGKYMAFDMYFKNYNPKTIYLGNKSSVTYEGEKKGIQNALRVAFVYEGNYEVDDYENLPTYLPAIQGMTTSDTSNVVIWEPNSTSHTEAGVAAALKYYNLNIGTTHATLPYKGIKAPIENAVDINSEDEAYFGDVVNLFSTSTDWQANTTTNTKIFDLPVGVSKVRIYAWVEGQDVDCENVASGSNFNFNLVFTTNPSAKTK